MKFKRKVAACVAICITAILVIAVGGCDDLGAYSNTAEYYDSFGDVIFLGGAAEKGKAYSVEEYFYNSESRENFLENEDGIYEGVEHSDYVYVAIPFNKDIKMDSLAMYMQAKNDVTVYINVYITDEIPENWKELEENSTDSEESTDISGDNSEENFTEISTGTSGDTSAESSEEISSELSSDTTGEQETYDDPDPKSRIGEITLQLSSGAWRSFTLDYFKINDKIEKSIYVENGQYILLQIRNNSGVRVFDEDKQLYVDEETGLVPDKAEITMTNLLVRALETENKTEAKEE